MTGRLSVSNVATARWVWKALWLTIAIAIVLVATYVAFINLGHYGDGYDDGVYLESARMMDRGYALYTSIFDSQAPLWLYLVDLGYKIGGESARSGRLPGAGSFVLTVAALIWAGYELSGRMTGLLAGGLVLLSPMYLRFARLVEADGPSAMFAAIAIACASRYANQGRRRWLVLSALAVTCSTLDKLLGLYTLPAIACLAWSYWAAKSGDWRLRMRNTLNDLARVLGILIGISLVVFLWLNPSAVWDQAVTFHLVARSQNHSFSLLAHVGSVISYITPEQLLVAGLPLALFAAIGRWRGAAVIVWAASAGFGLANQEPLLDHNVVTFIPPLALLIAFGWGEAFGQGVALARRLRLSTHRQKWASAVGAIVLLGVAGAGLARLDRHLSPAWSAIRALDNHSEDDAINLRVAPLVLSHSSPNDYILTDQQSVAAWLDRDVPPGLVDTSFVRIDAGYLTAKQVIDESTRYNVKMVVFASGRLTKLPEVVTWANQNFPNRVENADGRVVYWR